MTCDSVNCECLTKNGGDHLGQPGGEGLPGGLHERHLLHPALPAAGRGEDSPPDGGEPRVHDQGGRPGAGQGGGAGPLEGAPPLPLQVDTARCHSSTW